jgi:hypothetical protein
VCATLSPQIERKVISLGFAATNLRHHSKRRVLNF